MNNLRELPDADVLLALEPEELAPIVLRTAIANQQLHRQSITSQLFNSNDPALEARFPPSKQDQVELAVSEAWSWLLTSGIVVPRAGPNGNNGWMDVTRRGRRLLESKDGFAEFRKTMAFPRSMLHPSIAQKVWLDLMRGELDDAVFASFKAVEVAVRDAAKYGPNEFGITMMRKAFDPTNGPLTEKTHPVAEREALAHLFVGAIGSYKNPQSHRTVSIQDAQEAQEMCVLASHLLRIVDARRK